MNPADDVTWICQNQALVTGFLVWLFAVVPVASGLTWFTGVYDRLPPAVQTILHLLAGNLIHAFANPPAPKGAN